jgi:hypothetical protein
MGNVGDAVDNAVAESFFATLQTDLLDRHRWTSRRAVSAGDLRIDRGLLQPATPALDREHARSRHRREGSRDPSCGMI